MSFELNWLFFSFILYKLSFWPWRLDSVLDQGLSHKLKSPISDLCQRCDPDSSAVCDSSVSTLICQPHNSQLCTYDKNRFSPLSIQSYEHSALQPSPDTSNKCDSWWMCASTEVQGEFTPWVIQRAMPSSKLQQQGPWSWRCGEKE